MTSKQRRVVSSPDQRLSLRFDEAKVDAIFAKQDQSRLPGCAVGVAIAGTPVYRKGFGLASMDLPVVLSPTIRIRIGSVTKQFVAFAFMLLCEDGRATIDDTIGKYLPELNPVTHKITMRQLMGNNSCLRDAVDFLQQFSGTERGRVTQSDLLSFYRDSGETNFAPGVTNIYNNGGWIILSEVIERIAESTLEQVLRERVFGPVGMYDTLFHRWDAEYVLNSAGSHARNAAGKFERAEPVGGMDISGAGAMVSTVDDVLRWMAHMDAPTVGSSRTWELMKTPQVLHGVSTDYGLGLSNELRRGVRMIHHSGGGYGSNTQMVKVPDAGLDVIVMCNWQDNAGAEGSSVGLAERVLEACLPSLEPEDSRYDGPFPEGVFRSPRTGRAVQCLRTETVHLSGENISVIAMDGHFVPFAPDSKGALRPMNAVFPGWVLTPVGPLENPSSLRLKDFGIDDEFVRVNATMGKKEAITSIIGRYHSDETHTEALIVETDEGPRLKTAGRFGSTEHSLEYLADGVWRNRIMNRWILPPFGFVLFDAENGGFGFYNYLNRNVRFRRKS